MNSSLQHSAINRTPSFMSSSTSLATAKAAVQARTHWLSGKITLRRAILFLIAAVALFCIAAAVFNKSWPYSRAAIIEDLAEASDSEVTIRAFHQTYFPPGGTLEGVEFRHGARQFELITIERLTIEGSYLGILTSHVPKIIAEGARVHIPPLGSNATFHSTHSKTVVDEIVANGTTVEFAMDDPHKQGLSFDVHEALLNDVRWGSPIRCRLTLHNPNPPGILSVSGKFGAWADGHPQDTPLSGDYTLERADLSAYGGIGGLLASRGQFDGVFKHINISGSTVTPDFEVKSSGHKVKLTTRFDAFVDAMHGDTFLNRVEAHFGRTTVIAEGSVAGSEGERGKAARLRLTGKGRIEDILGLFVTAPHAPMSGPVSLSTRAELPPGNEPFLDKVRLHGAFGIDDGRFSKIETQKDVDALSAGARGQKKEDPETVLTGLNGQVDLTHGVAHFSGLRFGVPGAEAQMQGGYNLLNHKIDLHGRMRVDTKISKTASGVKALFLKVMDPIFKKRKNGEVVPVHIEGTYEKPQFGLDLTQPDHPPKSVQ